MNLLLISISVCYTQKKYSTSDVTLRLSEPTAVTVNTMGSNSLAMQMYEQMKRNAGGLTLEEIEAKQAASGAVENKE